MEGNRGVSWLEKKFELHATTINLEGWVWCFPVDNEEEKRSYFELVQIHPQSYQLQQDKDSLSFRSFLPLSTQCGGIDQRFTSITGCSILSSSRRRSLR